MICSFNTASFSCNSEQGHNAWDGLFESQQLVDFCHRTFHIASEPEKKAWTMVCCCLIFHLLVMKTIVARS